MNDPSNTHPANPIRILVVDDHTLFRRGLTALLARDPQLRVVGDAADAGQAQRRQRVDAIHARQVVVEQNYVGLELLRLALRLAGIGGVSDNP